jgi:hypothetical protein
LLAFTAELIGVHIGMDTTTELLAVIGRVAANIAKLPDLLRKP